jgi:hypothetical protein
LVQRRGFDMYMDIQISTRQLQFLLQEAAEMGASLALARTGMIKPYLKKAEAFRLYGRNKVERWIEEGLITPRKDGNHSACWRIDRLEIEALVKAHLILQFL